MEMKCKFSWIVPVAGGLLLSACSLFWRAPLQVVAPENGPTLEGPASAANGERIYFTATSARDTAITFSGGPNFGGMMMGRYLTCVSCHGPSARGGVHSMHMQTMDAPAITFAALSGELGEHDESEDEHEDEHNDEHAEYDLEDFRMAVIEGKHPDGDPLSPDMPRWRMSDEDLADLFEFLKTLE
jgi:mono/diheme cytochrome c family protein